MLAYCARVRASRIEEADSAASAGFYKKKLDEGFSATTVVYLHNVLHKALDTAVKWELVAKNVCDLVTPPRQKPFEVQALTLEQVQKLLAVSDGHHMEAFFKLALAIGMRRGELMGLKRRAQMKKRRTLFMYYERVC